METADGVFLSIELVARNAPVSERVRVEKLGRAERNKRCFSSGVVENVSLAP